MLNRPYESQNFYDYNDYSTVYNQATEPFMGNMTAPLPMDNNSPIGYNSPLNESAPETRFQRFLHGVGNFFAAIVRKINQLLGFFLGLLLLLLLIRFLLTLFNLSTSLFTQWIYLASNFVLIPFNNFLPPFRYNGMLIDVSVLVAMGAYVVAVVIVRRFLKVLVARV